VNKSDSRTTLLSLRSVLSHLGRRRLFQLAILLLVSLASGLAEIVSLGSVLPFLAVLTNPQELWQRPTIQSLALQMGYSNGQQLVLPAAVCFAGAALLAALIRLLSLWLNGRLASAIGSDLSCDVYRRTLYQPYLVHVRRNSSDLISALTIHMGAALGAINLLLQLVSSLVVSASILIGLLLIDWALAISTAAVFATAYWFVAITSRRQLQQNSVRIARSNNLRVKALQEGLGAIRDVILDGSQATYMEIYRREDLPQRKLEAKNSFLTIYPRYALEALGLVAIALVAVILLQQRGSGAALIPLLGALALGAQRLLPALQQVYAGWAGLKNCNAGLAEIAFLLEQPLPKHAEVADCLPLQECICLRNVHFRYSEGLPDVLCGLDLNIRRGERIGIVGSTGSGKSTLVDLLMGLLPPTSGQLLIDGLDLYESAHFEQLAAWRASVAHVPQSIYLADSSIAENIAFAVSRDSIDLLRLRRAAEQAQIAEFIDTLPGGYDTFVGERGIRLSGGQRQRIGIARALYKHANLIVLDEATSSLDNNTETAVMDCFEGLSENLTIIMIAHRLSTLSSCDRVITLSGGTVSSICKPRDLILN